jgi:hypothetical protein
MDRWNAWTKIAFMVPKRALVASANSVMLAGAHFGIVERSRETRFHVPKNPFIVTPPFSNHRKNQAGLHRHGSKIARIRAFTGARRKFQKTCPRARSASSFDSRRSRNGCWSVAIVKSSRIWRKVTKVTSHFEGVPAVMLTRHQKWTFGLGCGGQGAGSRGKGAPCVSR